MRRRWTDIPRGHGPSVPAALRYACKGAVLRLHGLLLGPSHVHDLASQMARHVLVAKELHREFPLTAGDRAEVGRVGEHLGHRDLGLDVGHATPRRLHPEGPSPTAVEIAD